MTDHNPNDAPRPLSPWNPLDHLRLLWWVLMTPQRLVAYREAFGENAGYNVGKWLASTLTWLPLFTLLLALGLGTLPVSQMARLPSIYLWVSTVVVLAWALTGWLGEETGWLAAVVALGIMLLIAVGVVVFGTMGNVAGSIEIVVAVGVALGVVVSVATVVPGGVPSFVAFLTATGAASVVAGRSAFIVAFLVLLVTTGPVASVVKRNLESGRPSRLAQGVFGALLLTYAFLIWFSFLGGWRLLQ